MTIKTDPKELLEHWRDYRTTVLEDVTDANLLVEHRRCFFAGAHSLMFEILKVRELPKAEVEPRLRLLDVELARFSRLAGEGLDRPHPEELPPDPPAKAKRRRKRRKINGKPHREGKP